MAAHKGSRCVIVELREGKSWDLILSASVEENRTLTSVEKSRTLWNDSAQVAKCPICTIGVIRVIPAPLRERGRDSIFAERASISTNSGWRNNKLEGSWG